MLSKSWGLAKVIKVLVYGLICSPLEASLLESSEKTF